MNSSGKQAVLITLFIAIAAAAYFLATGITDSIYVYRSPLKDNPPAAGEPLDEPIARKVVFVLIDALRYDTSLKANVMPTLNKLRSQAAYARTTSQTPSYSAPGYSVLFTGAWPYLSDGPAFNSSRLFLFTIVVTFIPVVVHFVWNGLFVGWTLPALGLHYVALLSLIQVMFLAGGAFLICLGLAIFVAKQKMEIAE